MSEDKDAVWKAYLDRYSKVYNPEANATATAEKEEAERRRKELAKSFRK